MKVDLIDYTHKHISIEIPDDTEYIEGVVLSGDMVMKYPKYEDSSNNRINDYLDGMFHISKKNFEALSKCKSSYDALELD